MDKLDIAILRELTQAQTVLPARLGTTPSNREIARKLKIPPGTLRYRIKRMYTSGLIEGPTVFPNPKLLGLNASAYTVDIPSSMPKEAVLSKLKGVEGAVFIHDFFGSLVWVVFVYKSDNELKKKIELMDGITRARGATSIIPFPPCTLQVNRGEAKLVLKLTRGGFQSGKDLANELGISKKTLERQLKKLMNENALVYLPKLNYHAKKDWFPADMLVFFENREDASKAQDDILEAVGERLMFAALWDVVGMCSLILPNVSWTQEIAERVALIPGVSNVRVEIVKNHFDQIEIFETYLEEWMGTRQ